MRIGFDLDNTLICYDNAFRAAALTRGILSDIDEQASKQFIRDNLCKKGPEGKLHWQALQGHVYGAGIGEAKLFDGVLTCLQNLVANRHELFIVSHKTRFGHFDESKIDLRDAARGFLQSRGVTAYILDEHTTFCETLADKLSVISALTLDVFVDDLADVLFHVDFPERPRRILFRSSADAHCERVNSWSEIQRLLTNDSFVAESEANLPAR